MKRRDEVGEGLIWSHTDTSLLARNKIYAGVPDDDVALALAICSKYQFDPLLKHVVMVKGRHRDDSGAWVDKYNVYVTRDGLLHVGHQSGRKFWIRFDEPERKRNPYSGKEDIYLSGTLVLDGVETWRAGLWFSEYIQVGRDGKPQGFWATHPAAAHQKVVEVYLLRRGFDVSLPAYEEVERIVRTEDVIDVQAVEQAPAIPYDSPEPERTEGQPNERPWAPERLRGVVLERVGRYRNRGEKWLAPPPNGLRGAMVAALDALLHGEENRHAFLQALFGAESSKDLDHAQVKVVMEWLDRSAPEIAADEARQLIALGKKEQRELPAGESGRLGGK